ncbi:MAG TPA: hypothetical protein VFA14_01065, partial [Herbaspirillum sp.]|nr:hypothetical protein [Herbaspirillum sp.]
MRKAAKRKKTVMISQFGWHRAQSRAGTSKFGSWLHAEQIEQILWLPGGSFAFARQAPFARGKNEATKEHPEYFLILGMDDCRADSTRDTISLFERPLASGMSHVSIHMNWT